ncbi:TPA: hypothetical protein HJJ02_004539 [Escherichia coli]|nr:hypothetical protein [Escherichia coli]HAI6170599.1 hypothetical protein [Escherichia coli]
MTSKTLISKTDDGYTFSISPYGDGYRLSVSPENRHNGTQSFDGWFPRFFSEPQYAKFFSLITSHDLVRRSYDL